ncbi:ABC transporter permease [Sphaerisporangium siamense]|uniref:Putative ABC transport system permease protein n=1 Tax=Sphaerisporangium siamense TaxID=795645 RepID=A0A7W7GBD1_9ACTN|nr:FtsX-like permease family protein [Sphaerisporangium siamense]MBB4702670.1 putative ABC transport system permease protein [Sphaerisporangium siamense]GII83576.1 ABC transporter permease [Sphaerisporangium siamense]
MLRLAFAASRGRMASLAGSFVALMFAVALVAACGMLMESGLRARVPAERYGAAPVVVAGLEQAVLATEDDFLGVPLTEPVAIPATLAGEIAKVPGVAKVVPEIGFPVGLTGARESVTGRSWESAALTPYTLKKGRAPATPHEIVTDVTLGHEIGQKLHVTGRDGLREYTVTGTAEPGTNRPGEDGPGADGRASVFFTPGRAAELFARPGKVLAFGVFGDGQSEELARRVERALGDTVTVYAGDRRGMAEDVTAREGREMLIAIGGSLGGVILMVAVLVVASAFGLAVRQRDREIALLRAIGATPRQIRAMIGQESLVIGVAAVVPGLPLGVALGRWLFDQFVARGMLPRGFTPVTGPLPLLVAAAVGLATAWLAARGAVRRAARVKPTEALGEAAAERRELGRGRMIAGLVFLALGLSASAMAMYMAGETAAATAGAIVLLLITAATLLGPWLVRLAARLAGGVIGRTSPVGGYLAVANTRTAAKRLASVAGPLILMFAFAATTLFSQSTIAHATTRQALDGNRADHILQAAGPGLPPEVARAARELPGVTGVTETIRTKVIGDTTELGSRTLKPMAAIGLTVPVRGIDLGVTSGSLDRLRGNGVALSTLAAGGFGASVGDKVRLLMGDGTPVRLTVVALYERGLGYGDVALPYALARDHSASGMSSQLYVTGGAKEGLAALAPGLTVLDRAAARAAIDTAQEFNDWVNRLLLGMIIVFIVISVVNTLVTATGARVREFALLRLVGGTRRQVRAMVRWEALLIGALAVVTGTLITAPTLMALTYGLTGSPLPHIPSLTYATMALATMALAYTATLTPTHKTLLGRPADQIRR